MAAIGGFWLPNTAQPTVARGYAKIHPKGGVAEPIGFAFDYAQATIRLTVAG